MQLRLMIGAAAFAVMMGGCSGLLRGFIDTQPRVSLDERALAEPSKVVGGEPVAFVPSGSVAGSLADDPDVLRFAPAIVQGFQPLGEGVHYEREDDAIGSPRLNDDATTVVVDTTRPSVYARVEHATVDGRQMKQLVYAFWYPRRPVGSVETGAVDGGILRVTLDDAGTPAIFEYSQPCGCFHGVFVSDAIADAASRQFGAPAAHRLHAVEPPLTGHDDWVVRALVHRAPGERIAMYISAGKHFCQTIASCPGDTSSMNVRPYAIEAYDALERVPRGAEGAGGVGSIFDADGRVIGAGRSAEQIVMGDLDHAGWPRHLDKMLIHWDAERWTDPTLLATKLRLPKVMSDRGAVAVEVVAATPATNESGGTTEAKTPNGRCLLLFTNAHCSGCQLTKQSIAASPPLQRAIMSWKYSVIDTATPEGEMLAAQHRVTLVPVLIGLDDGREVFRDEDIDSAEKIASALADHP